MALSRTDSDDKRTLHVTTLVIKVAKDRFCTRMESQNDVAKGHSQHFTRKLSITYANLCVHSVSSSPFASLSSKVRKYDASQTHDSHS